VGRKLFAGEGGHHETANMQLALAYPAMSGLAVFWGKEGRASQARHCVAAMICGCATARGAALPSAAAAAAAAVAAAPSGKQAVGGSVEDRPKENAHEALHVVPKVGCRW
jgi:hypothetical protein